MISPFTGGYFKACLEGELPRIYRVRVVTVRFGYGSCMGRFQPFRFSVPTVPLWKAFFCSSTVLTKGGGSGFPKGPKIEKFKIDSEIEIFKRAAHQTSFFLWGILKVKIEIFNRD